MINLKEWHISNSSRRKRKITMRVGIRWSYGFVILIKLRENFKSMGIEKNKKKELCKLVSPDIVRSKNFFV